MIHPYGVSVDWSLWFEWVVVLASQFVSPLHSGTSNLFGVEDEATAY